jgi:hypothetical protein
MTDKSQPEDIPPDKQPRWRLFGIRKRIWGPIATVLAFAAYSELAKIPAKIVAEGVSRYYGEYVADWLDGNPEVARLVSSCPSHGAGARVDVALTSRVAAARTQLCVSYRVHSSPLRAK